MCISSAFCAGRRADSKTAVLFQLARALSVDCEREFAIQRMKRALNGWKIHVYILYMLIEYAREFVFLVECVFCREMQGSFGTACVRVRMCV